MFINVNHTQNCYGCALNSRELVFCHASLVWAAVYNHNWTTHLLLCCIIPDAGGAKDWLKSVVDLMWVSRICKHFRGKQQSQQSGILQVCGKWFKWICLLLFFFITDHLFLTWLCFLLNEIALWRFLMSNVSCHLTKSMCGRPCEGEGHVKRTQTVD